MGKADRLVARGPAAEAGRKAKAALQDVRDSDAGRKAESALRDLRQGEVGRKAEAAFRDLREGDAGRKAKEALQDLRDSDAGRKAKEALRDLADSDAGRRPRPRCGTCATTRRPATSPDALTGRGDAAGVTAEGAAATLKCGKLCRARDVGRGRGIWAREGFRPVPMLTSTSVNVHVGPG